MMGCSVGPYKSAAVYAKNNFQILDRNIMYNLVVGALKKCGIDIAVGDKSLCCKTG